VLDAHAASWFTQICIYGVQIVHLWLDFDVPYALSLLCSMYCVTHDAAPSSPGNEDPTVPAGTRDIKQ
jgi:hypothetical protein